MSTETATIVPVKGMVFKHARRTEYDGSPAILTVTSILRGTVHSRGTYGNKVKTPVQGFASFVLEVVSVPGPKPASTEPPFTVESAKALIARAHAAGMAAGEAAIPAPMIVGSPSTPLGSDIDPSKPVYFVNEGVCGFAWVRFPGNTPFGRAAKKAGLARKSYTGGLMIWVSAFGQSLVRKEAYAHVFAEVLQSAGVRAVPESRLD